MILFLCRHVQVENPLNLCYGQSEIPLKEPIAHHTLQALSEFRKSFQGITYCSGLSRTYNLAQKLEFKNLILDNRLNEIHFGKWEGLPWSEIPSQELDAWMYNYKYQRPPDGENYIDLQKRIHAFYQDKIDPLMDQDQNVFILTHSGPILCFLSYFLDISLYSLISRKIPFGSILKIEINNHQKPVVYLNVQ